MTRLTEQLAARKITRVVAIDDENAIPGINTLDELTNAIASAKKISLKVLAKSDPRFENVVAKKLELRGVEKEEQLVELRPMLQELVESAKLGAADYERVSAIVHHGHVGATAERLKRPFAEVDFSAVSFEQWDNTCMETVKGTSDQNRLLLLVDERNEYEPASELNGKQLLRKLWAEHTDLMENVDTIIITSACPPTGEFDESRKLIAELRAEIKDPAVRGRVRRAFVISKERLQHGDLDNELIIHLNRIEASELRSQLADLTKQALHDAVTDSLQWLEDMPLSEFHGSVFASSEYEGSAEIETLLRLVSIRQRGEIEKRVGAKGPLQEKIAQMRKFSLKHLDPDYAKASRAELRSLRQQEFERSGDLLNTMMAPLSCGDVFRLTPQAGKGDDERLAVLLVNPCDLVLRSNGRRKAKRGWLVPLRKDSRTNLEAVIRESGDGATLLYKLYTGSEENDVGYLFTNSSVDAVDLEILDLCWTNTDGRAILHPINASKTGGFVMPAQEKRISILAQKAKEGRFRDVEIFGTEYLAKISEAEEASLGRVTLSVKVEYPIVRVFGLAPEFAAAALASLSQSISRPAFGHDFVRIENV